jgi:ABC-2 type transport system ATP-binding protein
VEQVAELKQRSLRRLEIRFGQTVPEQALAAVPGLHDLQVNNGIVYCTVVGSMDALIKALAGFQVESLISHEPSLEEIFLAYYNGTAQVSRDA